LTVRRRLAAASLAALAVSTVGATAAVTTAGATPAVTAAVTTAGASTAKATSTSTGGLKGQVKSAIGLNAAQFNCFDKIVTKESTWNPRATNASSGAYGLVQALPASKMASAGSDWRTNPATQAKWGVSYMKDRYGSPCAALAFHNSHGWY
jgi:hypothetical protein